MKANELGWCIWLLIQMRNISAASWVHARRQRAQLSFFSPNHLLSGDWECVKSHAWGFCQLERYWPVQSENIPVLLGVRELDEFWKERELLMECAHQILPKILGILRQCPYEGPVNGAVLDHRLVWLSIFLRKTCSYMPYIGFELCVQFDENWYEKLALAARIFLEWQFQAWNWLEKIGFWLFFVDFSENQTSHNILHDCKDFVIEIWWHSHKNSWSNELDSISFGNNANTILV